MSLNYMVAQLQSRSITSTSITYSWNTDISFSATHHASFLARSSDLLAIIVGMGLKDH